MPIYAQIFLNLLKLEGIMLTMEPTRFLENFHPLMRNQTTHVSQNHRKSSPILASSLLFIGTKPPLRERERGVILKNKNKKWIIITFFLKKDSIICFLSLFKKTQKLLYP